MRETSPFSDKQALKKEKKRNQNQHSARARNLFATITAKNDCYRSLVNMRN